MTGSGWPGSAERLDLGAAHRPGPGAAADPRLGADPHPAHDRAHLAGSRQDPGGAGQPAAGAPGDHAARRDRAVPRHRQRHRQRHHPGVPAPHPEPGQGLERWLRGAAYNHLVNLDRLWAHLHGAARGTTGVQALAWAQITLALVTALTALRQQIAALDAQITEQLAAHPDAEIFTSLPRSGTVRAARLLAEIGDARGRYPTPDALTCLAGAAPSTRQSGKVKVVGFRWAVDKQLRGAVIDFAGDSHHANPWAADLYQRARARGHDHPHAVRILAAPGCTSSGAAGRRRLLRPRQTPGPAGDPGPSRLTQGYSWLPSMPRRGSSALGWGR